MSAWVPDLRSPGQAGLARPGHGICVVARDTRYNDGQRHACWFKKMANSYFVYILASRRNGTLYVGVTNDLVRRMSEHRGKFVPGFTRKYGVDKLVYFEEYASILEARARERVLKRWQRAWKLALIEKMNPQWRDLSSELAF
jgi:putative endonuclease